MLLSLGLVFYFYFFNIHWTKVKWHFKSFNVHRDMSLMNNQWLKHKRRNVIGLLVCLVLVREKGHDSKVVYESVF